MPDLTNKVLQEISDLTKNMDVLVRELKDSKESQNKSIDSIQNLSGSITKAEENRTKSEEKKSSQQEGLFKNFTESIQKSMEERENKFLGNLSKSLSLDIQKAFNSFPNQVAEVKADNAPSKNFTSDIVSEIAKKASEKTPGLEGGGEITKKGIAVVGERGPELVELSKGDKVISNNRQLLEQDLLDARKKESERQVINSDLEGFIQSEKQKLENKEGITNSSGIKVPSEQIQKEREILKKDTALGFNEIEEKIQNFIEGYRETMSLDDIQKLNKNTKESEIKSENIEYTKKESSKEKIKTEEKLAESTAKKEEGIFSQLKESAKSVSEKAKESFKSEKTKLSEAFKPIVQKKEEPKKEIGVTKIQGDLMKLADPNFKFESSNKQQEQKPSEPKNLESPQKTESTKANTPQESATFETSTPKKIEKSVGKEMNPVPLDAKDVQEIKGLLAAIYKALSGPLNINSDMPFRPNSNHL